MPSRAELVMRAAVVGQDPTLFPNDSKLEQKLLYLEKNATAFTGTISTTTLTSDTTTVSDGNTVTLDEYVYTFKTTLTEAAGSSVLTSDTTAPTDGDFIQVDGVTYTAKTTLSSPALANEVLIGGSAAVFLDNLKSAINRTGTVGTDYSSATVIHPTVTATTNTDTTQLVVAKQIGTAGNLITTSETSTHLSWTGTGFTGGANAVQNEVLIGTNAAANLSNLKAAIEDTGTRGVNYSSNTHKNGDVTATTLTASTLVINSRNTAVANGDLVTTTTATHLSFTGSTMASGVAKVIAAASTNYQISGGFNI